MVSLVNYKVKKEEEAGAIRCCNMHGDNKITLCPSYIEDLIDSDMYEW